MSAARAKPAVKDRGAVKIPQKLFSPTKIGRMHLKNRLAMAPVGAFFEPSRRAEATRDFIVARARGGVGMLMMSGAGFTSMDLPIAPSVAQQAVKEARELVKVVHDSDVRIGVQLHHSGRQLEAPRPDYEVVAPSPIPWSPRTPVPRELTGKEIKQIIGRHVEAAERVKEADFDYVEIKACHGYLLSSFLSPHSNRRTDEYGGDLEGRARVVLEIVRGIRERLGNELMVCVRFNGADHVEGGLTLEDTKKLAHLFVEAGADFLSVTAGVYGAYPVIIPPMDFKYGCYLPLAEGIKSVVNVPVVVVGRIVDPWLAEDILQAGKADIVAMGRALITDPELPHKAQRGDFADILKCIGCNQGCQDRIGGLPTTCTLNPALGREKEMEIVPAKVTKKVLVIGGGPAGLEAARVAAERGHKVTLYEEDDQLGGQWRLAAAPPRKQEFLEVIPYLSRQIKKLGVKVKLGKRATAGTVDEEKPDAVIVATGAIPLIPPIPGVERKNVVTAWDVMAGKVTTGQRVLVVGGSGSGLDTADLLANQGKKVTVVEMMDRFATDLGPTLRWHLRYWLAKEKVPILTSTRVERIDDAGVVVTKEGQTEIWKDFDTIVLAVGARSRNGLAEELKGKVKEVYVIGDAAQPRNGLFAFREAAEVARKI